MFRLFEPTAINGMTIVNRFVRSATWERMANDDGSCTQELVDYMARLAKGGVGLIIVGDACVSSDGQAVPRQMEIPFSAAPEFHKHYIRQDRCYQA